MTFYFVGVQLFGHSMRGAGGGRVDGDGGGSDAVPWVGFRGNSRQLTFHQEIVNLTVKEMPGVGKFDSRVRIWVHRAFPREAQNAPARLPSLRTLVQPNQMYVIAIQNEVSSH